MTSQAENLATYYAGANNKKGADLKTALYGIIHNHTNIGYDGLLSAYHETDKRADGYLRDWYSNATNYVIGGPKENHSYSGEGDGYNREHLVPQSWFGSGEMKSDLVQVVPSDGYVNNIERVDDLEAANHVMLAPGTGQGAKLRKAIDNYREQMLTMITDEDKRKVIASNLTTKITGRRNPLNKNWEEYMFEGMPVAAAITMLSKLQSDIRYAEGEVLHNLVSNIDVKDIRVNKLSAFVIPNAQTVVRGDKFSAKIVMAAVDTTQQPQIYIGGHEVNLTNSTYEFVAGKTGDFTLSGYMTVQNG
jgi:hypothetical protein